MKLKSYLSHLKFSNIVDYFIILSPILLSSFFIFDSKYPGWANTLLLASIIAPIIMLRLIYLYKKSGSISYLQLTIFTLAFIFIIYESVTANRLPIFNLFGKGIEEYRVVGVLIYFVAAAYFITLKGKINMAAIWISLITIIYTLINYFLIRNNIQIANYTGYVNTPMISFAKLMSLPFIFTQVALMSSFVAYFIDKKDYRVGNLHKKIWIYIPLLTMLSLLVIMVYRDSLRYIASNHYYKADAAYKANNLELAKDELSRANVIAPFDEYYLARIEVTNAMINNFLAENSTTSAKESLVYKGYVDQIINDANLATDYDNRSARNYIALGQAYERSMLLSANDGYVNAMNAYENAGRLAVDKDYVDVSKAKLSFGANKIVEAQSYLEKALEFNPQSPIGLFTMSQYKASQNNIDEAISYGEKAVLAAPDVIGARLSLGLMYLEKKENVKAVEEFGQAYNLSSGQNLAAIYYLGLAYAALSDTSNLESVITELESRVGEDTYELKYLKSLLEEITKVRQDEAVKES